MHIYIYAPYNIRLQHCTDELGLSVDEGKRMIKRLTKQEKLIICNMRGLSQMITTTRI